MARSRNTAPRRVLARFDPTTSARPALNAGAFVWSTVLRKGTKVLAAANLITATFFLLFLIAPFDPSVDETFRILCTLLYGAQTVTLAVSMSALKLQCLRKRKLRST